MDDSCDPISTMSVDHYFTQNRTQLLTGHLWISGVSPPSRNSAPRASQFNGAAFPGTSFAREFRGWKLTSAATPRSSSPRTFSLFQQAAPCGLRLLCSLYWKARRWKPGSFKRRGRLPTQQNSRKHRSGTIDGSNTTLRALSKLCKFETVH